MPTALLSVYDKAGIVELARGLHDLGWRLVSSGGTAKAVAAEGIPVTDVAELTGFPAILGHRVVTLHPAVHAGLLADLDQPEHLADLERLGIEPISLAVVNLYPFSSNPGIELIDVGGPTMVRAAAKNHAHVAVVVDPAQYEPVLDELRRDGAVSPASRRRLARDAFAHTAAYDASIVTWFDEEAHLSAEDQPPSDLPRSLHLALDLVQPLRYGENPHQQGARYRVTGRTSWWDDAVQHGGKELSYLNLYDTEAAWRLVHRFDLPTCVIVKHANPCGVASVTGTDDDMAEAYVRANACDPTSAFGGIVACNRPITLRLAEALAPVFTEVVVAPAIDDDALAVLTAKKNLRVLTASAPSSAVLDMRAIDGGLLVQTTDPVSVDRSDWRVVTKAEPDAALYDDLVFAWQVCAAVSSNAIVLAKDLQAFGIGAGQQNRVDSARIAGARAAQRAVGGVCASDAYFPFRDGLDAVAGFGVRAVIEPGGSIRDEEVIAAADEHGIAMVFTGERHFRH
jgi:phosphoribosylaminoimidazolecarboxamide formyltransferase/IMP cyclohydrolase